MEDRMDVPPSSLVVAAAQQILWSKPLFVSVSDFIDRLRQCIPRTSAVEGIEACSSPKPTPKLDWKKRCLASESREADLLNQLSEQGRELERLRVEAAAPPQAKPANKRRRGQKEDAAPKKRPGADALPGAGIDAEWSKLEHYIKESNGEYQSKDERTLLRHLFGLEKLLSEDHPSGHKLARSLAANFEAACQLFPQSASERIVPSAHQSPGGDEEDSCIDPRTARILLRVIPLLSPAFEKLSFQIRNLPSARDAPIGSVIHAALALFRKLLDRLSYLASQPSGTRSSNWRSKDHQNHTTDVAAAACQHTASVLACFLRHFIQPPALSFPPLLRASSSSALKKSTNPSYEKLAEGCQYLLLTRAGELLHCLVFGQHPPTIDTHQPDAHDKSRFLTEEENSVAAVEAKFLAPLVKRACTLSLSPEKASSLDLDTQTLGGTARQRFLATLTSACFRGKANLIVQEGRAAALENPETEAQEELGNLLDEVDNDVQEGSWEFLGQMWDLFGWDIIVA